MQITSQLTANHGESAAAPCRADRATRDRERSRRHGQDAEREGLGRTTSSDSAEGEPDLLFIDLHLVHEVTSPQAFDGLRQAGRPVRRPDLTLATEDHNTPTLNIDQPIADPVSRTQVDTLRKNAAGVRRPDPQPG